MRTDRHDGANMFFFLILRKRLKMHTKFRFENLKKRGLLEDQDVDGLYYNECSKNKTKTFKFGSSDSKQHPLVCFR
jgi:hypothetical protein